MLQYLRMQPLEITQTCSRSHDTNLSTFTVTSFGRSLRSPTKKRTGKYSLVKKKQEKRNKFESHETRTGCWLISETPGDEPFRPRAPDTDSWLCSPDFGLSDEHHETRLRSSAWFGNEAVNRITGTMLRGGATFVIFTHWFGRWY